MYTLSSHKRKGSARANLMVAIGSILYFMILLLALYVMDRQVYTAEKIEIIRNNFLEIFRPPDNINDQARRALYTTPLTRRTEEQVRLQQTLQQVVDGPTSMYSMALIDGAGKVVVEAVNQDKPRDFNTWRNNLFIREFSGRTSQNVSQFSFEANAPAKPIGHLVGIYTSPVDLPAITSLTQRYRIYAGILTLGWLLAWLVIYYYLLRPVRNVTLQLDRDPHETPTLLQHARGALEQGYNGLAASALLQTIEDILNRAARAGEKKSSRAAAIKKALALTGEGFGADGLRVTLISHADSATESYNWERSKPGTPGAPATSAFPAPAPPENTDTEEPVINVYDDQSGFTWIAPLATGWLQVDCRYGGGHPPSPQFRSYLVRGCESLQSGFVAFQAYREQLFRERSEANISLSRNMGHDLTNIIATSKLELMGIKRILQDATEGTSLTGTRAAILSDSVSGLLESTRFMQEMVNIYRSFSYVKRPAYERRALAPLVEEFLQLFTPALSSHVSIDQDFPAEPLSAIVEPRLLKLALFNVLQNALDAVKRRDPNGEPGHLVVSLQWLAAEQQFEISVCDNGPGIRDEHNRMLSPAEIMAIFDYGYSTKGESGEGLGLNWVQTIMTDFHDGGVRASNRPDGGACISLWFSSMERKEARVGNASQKSPGSFGDSAASGPTA